MQVKNYILPVFLFLPGIFHLNAQDTLLPVKCYTIEHMEQQQLLDPSLKKNILAEEKKLSDRLNAPKFFSVDTNTYTIPVVVHVVYFDGSQNISDSRIMEQIQVLNEDFSANDPDLTGLPSAFQPFLGNAKLQFCLAQRDPNDNATTGITRTSTSVNGFSAGNNDIKYFANGGHDIWDRDKYLNIWVCKLTGGVVGFTTFPGSAADKDGVVMDYRYFGVTGATDPYDKGKSATHELGHWFNLKHIWGDSFCGNDSVGDTPTQQAANFGSGGNCPAFPHITCSNGPDGDMWMNYMDYGYDHCSYFFTAGQCTRLRTSLDVSRPSLKTSNGCLPVGIHEISDITDLSIYPNPASDKLNINISLQKPSKLQVNLFNVLGENILSISPDVSNSASFLIDLNGIPAGVYTIEFTTEQTRVVRKIIVSKS